MSDPLSIAAGVAGLISLGIEVSKGLVAFYRSSKHQDETITRTVRKLENLLSTLENLESALQKRRFRPDEVNQLHNVEDSVESCRDVITELQTELDKFGNSTERGIQAAAKRAGRKLAYPFRESTLQKLDEEISEFRSNLLVALNVLQLKRVDDIQNDTADLTILVNLLRTSQISDTVRDWLKAPDATFNHNEACKRRHSRTGLWLVNGPAFQKWLEDDYSFLWLNGRPGSGKTVLSSTTIQYTLRHRRSNPRIGIAFYYFSFSDNSKQNVSGLLRALLLQLSSQLDDGHAALASLKNTYRGGEPPLPALHDTLKQLVNKFEDVYIIADALDESPREEHREAVLHSLTEMHGWAIRGLHMLVTSRDEVDIRTQLASQLTGVVHMDGKGVDEDIADYVVQRLRSDHKFKKWASYHTEIQETLIKRAHGIFRWVDCQFTTLASCPSSRYHLKKALNSLPRSLDETYSRMLMNIDLELREDAKRILTWLCFAKRPVTVQEIIDGLMVELGENSSLDRERRLQDANDVIWICPGLISLSTPDSDDDLPDLEETHHASLARIAHFSVQEYLESQRIKSQIASVFALNGLTANTELAMTCLVYLRHVQVTDLERFPLALYAARYWHQHLLDGDENCDSLNSLATAFLSSKDVVFEDWIRLSDPHLEHFGMNLELSSEDIGSPLIYVSCLGLYRPLQMLLENDSIRSAISVVEEAKGLHITALMSASRRGHDMIVQLLLEKGAEVNTQTRDGATALYIASFEGHKRTVQLLLDQGADVNTQAEPFGTVLQTASWEGHETIVQMLLDKGAEVNVRVGDFGTALQAACFKGYERIVQLLLNEDAEVNIQAGGFGTALHAASSEGYERIVRLLLDKGAEINAQTENYGNALHGAASRGRFLIVKLLLDHGAEVNAKGGFCGTALQAASYSGHEKLMLLLLNHGAHVNAEGGFYGNALNAALRKVDEKLAQLLLDRDAKFKSSALESASLAENEKWVQRILDSDIEFDIDEVQKAIEVASRRSNEKIVELLLNRGAQISNKVFEEACSQGHEKMVRLLLDRGADITGHALTTACEEGCEKAVQLLLDEGAEVTKEALGKASARGQEKVVQLLLDSGADINDGALASASAEGKEKVVQVLLNRGAEVTASAIQAASKMGKVKVVHMLLDKATKLDGTAIGEAIRTALKGLHWKVVQVLLDSGVGIDDNAVKVALEMASEWGVNRVVRLILARNAKIDISKAIQVASSRGVVSVLEQLLDKEGEIDSETIEAAMQVASGRCSEEITQLLQKYKTTSSST